jgi:hypothetical protein
MVFLGMGFELAGLALGATYLGQYIDNYFHWNTLATIILILSSLGVWFYHIIFLLKQMDKNDESNS